MVDLRTLVKPDLDTLPEDDRPEVRVLLAAPRGFCAGVRRAIQAVRDALRKHGAPVYVRHAIVHNLTVVRQLESEGAIFVEELDQVPESSVVLFSAHGVSPAIAIDARHRGLIAYDAVCPLVTKVHREVERHELNRRQIILVGHRGHPEVVATLGRLVTQRPFVVSSVEEVKRLPIPAEQPAAYAIQTTFSVDDARDIVDALRARFLDIAGPNSSDICYATTNRQAAVREVAAQADAVIVVGEHLSSHACRLAEVARVLCANVQLVAGADALDWEKVPPGGVIGITAAASTPEEAVQGVITALGGRYRVAVEEMDAPPETTVFKPLAI
jgi:4-hydroxy-3-methylbut-2-enyl diphosphate reductase